MEEMDSSLSGGVCGGGGGEGCKVGGGVGEEGSWDGGDLAFA